MRRRRQVLAAVVALRQLQEAHRPAAPKPAPPKVVRRVEARAPPPPPRVVEQPEPAPANGNVAAVEKIARKALDASRETIAIAEGAQVATNEVRASLQQIRERVESIANRPAPEPPPEQIRVEVPAAGPTREDFAGMLDERVGPLVRRMDEFGERVLAQVAQVERVAGDAMLAAAAANAREIPVPLPPQPPVLPDFIVGQGFSNGHLLNRFHSGKVERIHLPRSKVVRGGGRASSAQMAEWEAQSSGGGDVLLTYAEPTQATVGAVAANVVASASATFRRVTIALRSTADTGIYLNPAGTATTSHFLLQPGGSRSYDTNQAISAIRAGGSDVVADVQVGVGA